MIERQVDVTTPDGEMTTFIFHSEHGGPFPVVLYLMDAPSIRPALKDMASRLATAGYYVMLPYLFYRGGPFRFPICATRIKSHLRSPFRSVENTRCHWQRAVRRDPDFEIASRCSIVGIAVPARGQPARVP
jgi:dienelactone hydrolase